MDAGLLFVMQKLTKIIATLSHTVTKEDVLSYSDAGMDAVRINTAHETVDGARRLIRTVRQCAESLSIILDTKGPDIRIHPLDKKLMLEDDDRISIITAKTNATNDTKNLVVNYGKFISEVPLGTHILIDNQSLELRVVEKNTKRLICEVVCGGLVQGNKGVNVPGVTLSAPSLTKTDKAFLKLAAEESIEYIAHSFVRDPSDINAVRDELSRYEATAQIIAKIENEAGVMGFTDILAVSDGIMVARGDLGIEIPIEQVPVIQKEMITKCINTGKIAITATQMLYSMISSRFPTRAEVSDVANAVYDGSDALMLSGETAYGKYPKQSLATMTKIIRNVELHKDHTLSFHDTKTDAIPEFLANTAVLAAHDLPIKAICVQSQTGRNARLISSQRIGVPIISVTESNRSARELSLYYGIYSHPRPKNKKRETFLSELIEAFVSSKYVRKDDLLLHMGHADDSHKRFVEIGKARDYL
jgi:pyruvate kinase